MRTSRPCSGGPTPPARPKPWPGSPPAATPGTASSTTGRSSWCCAPWGSASSGGPARSRDGRSRRSVTWPCWSRSTAGPGGPTSASAMPCANRSRSWRARSGRAPSATRSPMSGQAGSGPSGTIRRRAPSAPSTCARGSRLTPRSPRRTRCCRRPAGASPGCWSCCGATRPAPRGCAGSATSGPVTGRSFVTWSLTATGVTSWAPCGSAWPGPQRGTCGRCTPSWWPVMPPGSRPPGGYGPARKRRARCQASSAAGPSWSGVPGSVNRCPAPG